jgi:hypothetical protein
MSTKSPVRDRGLCLRRGTLLFALLAVLVVAMGLSSGITTDPNSEVHGIKSNSVHDKYCNRPWPQLELLMPLNIMSRPPRRLDRNHEPIQFFLRTFLYFWPVDKSNTSLVFVVDEEKRETTELNEFRRLVKAYSDQTPSQPKITVKSNAPTVFNSKNNSYDRQQLLKFYADNFTGAEFVGFVDSDTAFTTYVDREDIFEFDPGNVAKPVVNGRTGYTGYSASEKWSPEHDWPWSTFQLLGLHEPVRCMSNFPIVFRTYHIKELRGFVTNRVSSA